MFVLTLLKHPNNQKCVKLHKILTTYSKIVCNYFFSPVAFRKISTIHLHFCSEYIYHMSISGRMCEKWEEVMQMAILSSCNVPFQIWGSGCCIAFIFWMQLKLMQLHSQMSAFIDSRRRRFNKKHQRENFFCPVNTVECRRQKKRDLDYHISSTANFELLDKLKADIKAVTVIMFW